MATANFKFTSDGAQSHFNLNALSTAPTDPETADIYLDDGTNTADSVFGFRRYNGTSWVDFSTGLLNKTDATAAPAVTDDSDDGYAVGSLWIDVTADNAYILVDSTVGAAVWQQIDGGGGGMTSFDVDADTGTAETVADGNTLTIAGGTGIDTSVGATDTVTIAIDSTVATLTGTQTLTNKTLEMGDNVIERAEMKDYSETLVTDTDSGATHTIDVSTGNHHALTLTANCTLTFSNPSPTGKACSFTLRVIQDGTGSRTLTYPASVDWAGGSAPTLTTDASAVDFLTFLTYDAGTTWYGFPAGLDFS